MTIAAGMPARLRRLASLPPRELMLKVAQRLGRSCAPLRDLARSTYSGGREMPGVALSRLVAVFPEAPTAPWLEPVVDLILGHRFALLGSGWVHVHHGMTAAGIEGMVFAPPPAPQIDRAGRWLDQWTSRANRGTSRRTWQLVDAGYQPIDWHIDFKSGFRWPARRHYSAVRYGNVPGADVKVPWELARCQHHPWLARAFATALAEGRNERAESLRREFRNQVLDFIAANPPRYGVNWAMPMDVAIRAANWLVALDLFRAAGAQFDAAFLEVLQDSLFDHGAHVLQNLEWSAFLRSNHYLANIAGLLFIAAYLPRSPRVDAWLAFAVQELHREVLAQFGADGGNFEASTSYHRLSCEMALYATAVVLGLPESKRAALQEFDPRWHRRLPPVARMPQSGSAWLAAGETPLSDEYFERLYRAVSFTRGLMRSDGHVPQIGDADSGRMLKVSPAFTRSPHWREDFTDHRHLLAAYSGLFDMTGAFALNEEHEFETRLLTALAGGVRNPAPKVTLPSTGVRADEPVAAVAAGPAGALVVELEFDEPTDLRSELRHREYPQFGVYVIESSRLHLVIRCGPIGQNGFGGHAHNDQLSFELAVDGKSVFVDSGSYLYTALPDWRNRFRSTFAHSTIHAGNAEQNDWLPGRAGLFSLVADRARARKEQFGDGVFCGSHGGFGVLVRRRIEVLSTRLRIVDEGPPGVSARFCLAPAIAPRPTSNGRMGLQSGTMRLPLTLAGEGIVWHVADAWYSAGYGEKTPRLDIVARRGEHL